MAGKPMEDLCELLEDLAAEPSWASIPGTLSLQASDLPNTYSPYCPLRGIIIS